MKKLSLLFAGIMIVSSAVFFTSCKEDIEKPVITLKGDAEMDLVLNATFTDPGYTATDNVDGDLTASVTVTGTVNKNLAGTYMLTYSVTDVAGNVGIETRKVTVKNDAASWGSTNYSAVDTEDGTQYSAQIRTVNVSEILNNRLIFVKFSDREDANVLADISGNTINVPVQKITCGSGPGEPQERTFEGSGTINPTNYTITINYTIVVGSATINCNTIYTKQ